LLKDVAVSHVPTANGWLSLKRLGQQPVATEPLLAWGDPLFDAKATQQGSTLRGSTVRSAVSTRSMGDQQRNVMGADDFLAYSKIPPLPETRDEVIELANILSANIKEDLVLGADATRASVIKHNASGKLAKKQVVVFATHGLLAGDLPYLNQPALAMAATPNPGESPLLTLEDVLALKLNADWVVLSACNTAGADGRAEEALSGLARGFFYAGGRSLLVTHWSVESESAMMLTTHTFAAYKKNPQMRRAEALRQAMLETMKDARYTHPAYWAPYALVGEGGR
jgi:CHAT domain-containing protein